MNNFARKVSFFISILVRVNMTIIEQLLGEPSQGLVKELRPQQLRMATNVAHAIEKGGIYTVEGPVGIGKTYAYLLPALLAKKRVIVATPKKSLQDQIANKDLPALSEALKLLGNDPPKFLILKGRSNYACQLLAITHGELTSEYLNFLKSSQYGDRAEYPSTVPSWWNSATAEKCIGSTCSFFNSCGYANLLKDLRKADVIVTNHHLLGFDLARGLGSMFDGPYSVLIVDEAHSFSEGIRTAFYHYLTHTAVVDLARELNSVEFYSPIITELVTSYNQMLSSVREEHRKPWPVVVSTKLFTNSTAVRETVQNIESLVRTIEGALTSSAEGDKFVETDRLSPAAQVTQAKLASIQKSLTSLAVAIAVAQKVRSAEAPFTLKAFLDGGVKSLVVQGRVENTVVWTELKKDTQGNYNLHVWAAPINLGSIVGHKLTSIPTVIMTSATLAVDQNFDHLRSQLGITPSVSDILESPFDYVKQAGLYIPIDLPNVKRASEKDTAGRIKYLKYVDRVVEECYTLIQASNGNAFILTTANDEMSLISSRLKKLWNPIFTQGEDGDPQTILKKFLTTESAVLIGSRSFWEGIDVQGGKLRLVIIQKLPFPMIGDPIIKARKDAAGPNAFHYVDYADMLTDLRQGTGRLIRSVADRGLVAILDSRVWSKPYGVRIRNALPYRRTTKYITEAVKYLEGVNRYYERTTNGAT